MPCHPTRLLLPLLEQALAIAASPVVVVVVVVIIAAAVHSTYEVASSMVIVIAVLVLIALATATLVSRDSLPKETKRGSGRTSALQ